jgi:inosine-uridine nucleoside N-ribohydrolase
VTTLARLLTFALAWTFVSGCHPRHAGRGSVPWPAAISAPLAVFLTTDCGVDIDDQWALAHLALSPEFVLRGIVPTHASSVRHSSAASAQCASDVLKHVVPAKAAGVPVIAGSDAPLHDVTTARDNAGVQLLLRLSRQFSASRRLVVLSTGAATDLASAIVEDPSITSRVIVVAMGFTDWPRGGPEFNITNDPVAWQVILSSDVPLVVGSAEATKRGLHMTSPEAAALMRPHGAIGEYLFSLFDRWLAANSELVARMVSPGTWVIWDEVVVAYSIGLATGADLARPRLEPDLSFSHPATSGRITWITRIESDRVWRDFTRKIDRIP